MSDHYVDSKINEALKATNGDEKDAVKLIITWAVRDQALLLGLAKPELKTLASERVKELMKRGKKGSESHGHKEAKDAIVFAAGKGEKRHPVKVPPPKTSERQASVMHQLVAAFKKQK